MWFASKRREESVGNQIAVRVTGQHQPGSRHPARRGAVGIDLRASKPGSENQHPPRRVGMPSGADAVTLVVGPRRPRRRAAPGAVLKAANNMVNGVKNDPDIQVVALGTVLPAALTATPLERCSKR